MKKQSAKDIAFEKERVMFRQDIRNLERINKQCSTELYEAKEKIRELESQLEERDEWIRRLLEYTEMSEEDMKKTIQREKDRNAGNDALNRFFGMYSSIFNGRGFY